jgi:hypothetical protein
MRSAFCLLLAGLLSASVSAASYPVMQCVNEDADNSECITEAKNAVTFIEPWFNPYLSGSNNRHLIDCDRFCDPNINYFSLHLPCDCNNSQRMLTPKTEPVSERGLLTATSPLEGPIQLLEAFSTGLPAGRCKDIFSQSRCIITFVEKYEYTILVDKPSDEAAMDDKNTIDFNSLTPVDTVTYDPSTGEQHQYDPNTGMEIIDTQNDVDPNNP